MTCLEDLSNEIFYEIFDYIDTCNAYEAFYHLNNRFRYLFVQLSLPYKINFDLISKRIFEERYQYIITPNKHRIVSLYLSNCICLENFSFDSSFVRLESLILNEIKSDKLGSLLMNLAMIPQLFSLSMTTVGIIKDPNTIHQLIFALPVLKYCNTTFKWYNQNFSLTNCMDKTSPIEHFVSKSTYNLKSLNILLWYMPRLVRLSCNGYSSPQNSDVWRPITLNNLRYFHLDYSVSFGEFEIFMSNLFHQVEVLRITSSSNNDYLDSNRWKQLILTHLPCLHTFDLQYFGNIPHTHGECHSLIDGFISPFWIERKWFFDHHTYRYNNILWIFFYSVKQTYSSQQVDLDFLRRIIIQDGQTTIDLHSSQLTLSTTEYLTTTLFNKELNQMIPLKQLKKLIVISNHFDMKQLMELLDLSSNIQILILSTYPPDLSSSQNKINNNIQQIIIHEQLTLKDVQQLINTYPRLKSLEMKIRERDLELIIRFILKHNPNKNSSLHLLILQDAHSIIINRIQKVIDREELLQSYSIQYNSDTAYLWW